MKKIQMIFLLFFSLAAFAEEQNPFVQYCPPNYKGPHVSYLRQGSQLVERCSYEDTSPFGDTLVTMTFTSEHPVIDSLGELDLSPSELDELGRNGFIREPWTVTRIKEITPFLHFFVQKYAQGDLNVFVEKRKVKTSFKPLKTGLFWFPRNGSFSVAGYFIFILLVALLLGLVLPQQRIRPIFIIMLALGLFSRLLVLGGYWKPSSLILPALFFAFIFFQVYRHRKKVLLDYREGRRA